MPRFQLRQQIQQLEPRKGGYFYVQIDADLVEQFPKKRATRLKCTLDEQITFSCGLNHLGDGNYFIIIAGKYLKTLHKKLGDPVTFEIVEDPNPLGVEEPEVLLVLLEQDETAKKIYNDLTDGKKRSLIYSFIKLKDMDKQVEKILAFLENVNTTTKKHDTP